MSQPRDMSDMGNCVCKLVFLYI